MQIEKLKIEQLTPSDYNPRKDLKPGDPEYDKLKRSIEQFGYVELIVVNEATGFTVISGHQRLSVLKALGYDSVECVVVSLDATREKALNIAMNKISGEWDTKKLESLLSDLKAEDFDVSLTGFDSTEIGMMLGVEDEIVQDEVPEINTAAPTICQRGELWQLGRHRLLCGSSTDKSDVAQLMDGQLRKYADSEYRYLIEVDGEFPQDRVLRFCRNCLNGGGVDYEEWNKDMSGLQDKNDDISTYFNGYYKFDKILEEKDARGIVTKASYAYKVVIPYCD